MTVLLDTHVWLWMLAAPSRLRAAARDLVEDANTTLLLSAASTWEIAIKYAVGRLPIPEPPERYVPERMRTSGVDALPIELLHTLRVSALEPHHRDPFDRLLDRAGPARACPVAHRRSECFARYDVEVIPAA